MPIDASTTVTTSTITTVTVTTTFSSTSTTFSTTTSTSVLPVATFYAACDTNNIVSSVSNLPIYVLQAYNGFSKTNATSAYDCCVACLLSNSCGASTYSFVDGTTLHTDVDEVESCYTLPISPSGQCDPSISVGNFRIQPGAGISRYTLSNGNCGQVSFAGSYYD